MEGGMKKSTTERSELIRIRSQLESVNDHLMTELTYVDHLLRMVGFAGGLATVKATAREMVEMKDSDDEDDGMAC